LFFKNNSGNSCFLNTLFIVGSYVALQNSNGPISDLSETGANLAAKLSNDLFGKKGSVFCYSISNNLKNAQKML
jgi:hypothetical protein